jgi:histidinol phosphatase-like PHP family hydrolase/DNA repair ATPase RecN
MNDLVGTRYYSVDLHVHTPASADYSKVEHPSPRDLVQSAIDADLDAIAIVDHNTPAWIEAVREAARGTKLVVFPGVEINAQGGHIIALFDVDAQIDIVETAIIEAGISKTEWGRCDVLANDILRVIATVHKYGGLAIGAHADGPKGFLTTTDQGATRIRIFKDPNLSALELVSLERKDEYVSGSVAGYDRPIACIQGSDAHSPTEIGVRRTLLRMHHRSLEGLRQAFFEPALRVRFPSEWSAPAYPYIASLRVSQGFLSSDTVRFNPNLNCLVGGAGSGKSTVIEFLRFALDQVSGMKQIAEDCHSKLCDLAGPGACIEVHLILESGDQLNVTRLFNGQDNPITVKRTSPEEALDGVDISTLFPIHAYSQGEAVSISRNPLAQLELIDRHLDLSGYLERVAKARRDLDNQTDGLVKLEAAARDRDEVQRQIATLDAQIHNLTSELQSLEKARASTVVTSHQLWTTEKNYLVDLVESFDKSLQAIEDTIDEIELLPLSIPLPDEPTPNKPLLQQCAEATLRLEEARAKVKTILLGALTRGQEEVVAAAKRWKELFEAHEAEYRKFQLDAGEARIREVNSQLESLRQKLHGSKGRLRSIGAAEETLRRQLELRRSLLADIRDQRDRVFYARKRKAAEFVRRIGDTISLGVVHDGNREEYRDLLASLLRGTYAQQSTVDQLCASTHPCDLADLLRSENVQGIDRSSSIGEKWAGVLLSRAQSEPRFIYQLEGVPLEDRLEIGFKVEQGKYRPIDKLSTGQKATVIVLLTMVEGKQPIVFDQPEDALYTPFIYTEVVSVLRRGKDQRQFILATHNPNIAIAGDTDLSIVLEGTATQAKVESAGGLDDEPTRDLILWHLEGGDDAFRTRGKKLGL